MSGPNINAPALPKLGSDLRDLHGPCSLPCAPGLTAPWPLGSDVADIESAAHVDEAVSLVGRTLRRPSEQSARRGLSRTLGPP